MNAEVNHIDLYNQARHTGGTLKRGQTAGGGICDPSIHTPTSFRSPKAARLEDHSFARALACAAERWGYERYWIAEHHNMTGAAGAATGTVVAYIAGATSTIRVGAGGIMLPNHARR